MSEIRWDPIFLKPVLKETIWGGSRLSLFGYPLPSSHTGEAWGISAHPHGDCEIADGPGRGEILSTFFQNHRDYFGCDENEPFPLLVKIIDAEEDLSIQVHPDDAYAAAHEQGSCGKTECLLILQAKPGARMILGHFAKTKEEVEKVFSEGSFRNFVRKVPIKAGDLIQVDPGCVHAIPGGTLVLEIGTNCDITYRIYDYDRKENGRTRPLSPEKSMDVITVPFEEHPVTPVRKEDRGGVREELISCPSYQVERFFVKGEMSRERSESFCAVSILDGTGWIGQFPVRKGDHLILPAGYGPARLKGNLEVVFSSVPKKM